MKNTTNNLPPKVRETFLKCAEAICKISPNDVESFTGKIIIGDSVEIQLEPHCTIDEVQYIIHHYATNQSSILC